MSLYDLLVGKPSFVHNCSKCTFLGVFEKHDLYHCASDYFGETLTARFGDAPDDNKSDSVHTTGDDRHLNNALFFALCAGLTK